MALSYRSLLRTHWKSVSVILLGAIFFLGDLLFKPAPAASFTFGDNIIQGILEICGLWLALPLCLPSTGEKQQTTARQWIREHKVQLLFSATLFSYIVGQFVWTLNENILKLTVLFPTWADAGYLVSYPFALLAILLLPYNRLSLRTRIRLLFDRLMMMVGVVTFSWYFILGPTIEAGADSRSGQLIGTAYPTLTLLLIFSLCLLVVRTSRPRIRPVIFTLLPGLSIIMLTNVIYNYQQLHNTYMRGSLLDLGWPLGYMLIGLAARFLYTIQGQTETEARQEESVKESKENTALWMLLLPYIWVPATGILLFVIWRIGGDPFLVSGVVTGGVVLIALILCRQVLAIQETVQTKQALQEKNTELAQANDRLASLATTDVLTNLPNHRALSETLGKEVERARRYGHSLSLLFFDGDRFKQVNDTHGHAAGDAVLRELGTRAKSVLRAVDTVGRYGGEEFLIILPETSLDAAVIVAERLREAVASFPLATSHVKGGIAATVSIGVASYPQDGYTGNELREKADQAMYWAKRLGRNQVRTAADAEKANNNVALKAATAHTLKRHEPENMDSLLPEQQTRVDHLEMMSSLMRVLEWRYPDLNTRSHNVSDLVTGLAQVLQMEQKQAIQATTALLPDAGKIERPDSLSGSHDD